MDKFAGILMTGARAGIWYMDTLQKKAREKKQDSEYVLPVKTFTIPFQAINNLLPGQMDKAGKAMMPYFREMEKLGIEGYILANITLHEAFDQISHQLPNGAFLHLREIIIKAFTSKSKLMLIGSQYTMRSNYLPSLFESCPVEFIPANEATQKQIDELRKVFYTGKDHKMAALVFGALLKQYPHVDAFVISCTEHALAMAQLPDKKRFVSLPELQIEHLLGLMDVD